MKRGLSIPEYENYNTLGGYILDVHQSIPTKGMVVRRLLIYRRKTTSNRLEEAFGRPFNWLKIYIRRLITTIA